MTLTDKYITSLFTYENLKKSNPIGDNTHKKYNNLSIEKKLELLKITDPNIIKKSLYLYFGKNIPIHKT